MGSESDGGGQNQVLMEEQRQEESSTPYCLEKFTLFETPSNFYMIGRDEERMRWRVLKIGRSEPSKLVIYEDPTIYSFPECKRLLQGINEGNKLTGGRKFVTTCYGIVGFIKFLGPYYILLITERKKIGQICGHPIYAISEYKMIPITHPNVLSFMDKDNRYKNPLWLVDITKNFFFSYSYPIMHSLQNNLGQKETGLSSNGAMFVWNEYLTCQIRNHLKNTLWTVALVHGFFKQVMLSNSGKTFSLTLIARRSCHFAGTRYQKRGVNGKGQAANEVEIEQIVFQDINGECPYKITSVVQNRGSIPLCWSQKPSWWNLKPPDILLSKGNNSYEATQLHFQNLRLRYGDPVVILNLVKTSEKMSCESLIHDEFHKAVDCINMDVGQEDHLEFLSLDLDLVFRIKGTDVLTELTKLIASQLKQVGIFSCQIPSIVNFKPSFDMSYVWMNNDCAYSQDAKCHDSNNNNKHQKGIIRTNCLDTLDRTNVAQYVYSLIALGHQLDTLKITLTPELDFNHTLAYDLMSVYEAMGDALAQQYGGSPAHSKIFSKSRGQSKEATQFQEFMKTTQRYYNNIFMDANKQKAIDLFLGHFRPEDGESAPLKRNLDKRNHKGRLDALCKKKTSRPTFKRSKSDSKIAYKRSPNMGDEINSSEFSSSESDLSNFRCTPTPYMSSGQLLTDIENQWFGGVGSCLTDEFIPPNWIGSSRNSEHDS